MMAANADDEDAAHRLEATKSMVAEAKAAVSNTP